MARSNVAVTTVVKEGVTDPSATPGTVDGLMFANDGSVLVVVENTGVGSHTATFTTTKTDGIYSLADLVVTVPAGATFFIGPFPNGIFNQFTGSDVGKVYVNFDATESECEMRVLHLG